MGVKVGSDVEAAVIEHFRMNESIRAAGDGAGCSFHAAKRILLEAGMLGAESKVSRATPCGAETILSESGDSRNIEFQSDKPIRTLEEAIEYAGVDLAVWRVKKWECGGWQVGMKVETRVGRDKVECPVVKQLWRVRLFLERILPKSLHEATDAIFDRMKEHSPKHPPAFKKMTGVPGRNPHLMVMDLVDVHFGKLAWKPEAGQNYDLKIAEQVYHDAVLELLARAEGFDVGEFLVPLGSDFLHVDGLAGTTTGGTPQDVDGRLAKIIETAEMAIIWAIGVMANRGNVVVRWVPGNHDRLMSYCLARTISAWYRNHKDVTVDVSPAARKYHRFGRTLIGLTHGNEEKHASLPALMATEVPQDWADSSCREWHVGHQHRSKRLDFMALDTFGGVPVRTLKSLSATDAWHYRKGYVGSQRAAEAYLYDSTGLVGFFCANVKDST